MLPACSDHSINSKFKCTVLNHLRKMLLWCSVIFFIFFSISPATIWAQRNLCSISYPKADDRLQPLILTDSNSGYDFVIPERGAITIRPGQSVALFCPHIRNKLIQSNYNLTSATCISGETLKVANQHYQFDELQCSSPVKGDVELTNKRCGSNRGKIINIGHKVPRSEWITLIQVCYDSNEGNALYAQHTLYGQAIEYASKQSYRPAFQESGLIGVVPANIDYKQATQKKVFERLLGSENLAEKYLYKNSFLSRGHLAPDADFLFPGLQFTTYFYINTCPQWEAVNAGNWLGIEHMVRKFAARYQKPLRIITGSHGILSLPDINNNLQDLSLDTNGKLPVPKFLWKIVYSDSSKEGVAFVAINDPFIKRVSEEDILCPNICDDYGWNSDRWSNVKKGFVYCCDVRELQRIVHTIPKLTIKNILTA